MYYQHGIDYALPAKLTSLSSVPVIDDHSLDRTRVATTHAQVVVLNCSFPYEMDLRLCDLSAQAHKPIHPELVGKEPGLPRGSHAIVLGFPKESEAGYASSSKISSTFVTGLAP